MIPRKDLARFVVVVVALIMDVYSFSITSAPLIRPFRQQRLASSAFNEETIRAGEAGYSLIRQPVKWDPDAVPTFGAPTSLREEDSARKDAEWLNQRMQQRGGKSNIPMTAAVSQSEARAVAAKQAEQMEDLNLFQRTLDTLDYPIVLKALRGMCTTRPARDLVQDASEAPQKVIPSVKGRRLQIPEELKLAYQPLTATSQEGAVERYAAVREMQILLDWRSDVLLDAFYRNRKGYKEDLGAPPMGGMNFDLKEILDIADKGNVLEGPEILEIVSMMDSLEDIQLWGKGLAKVENDVFVVLPKIVDCISVNTTLHDLLHNAFDNEGRLSGTTFPMVGFLRKKIQALKSDILGTLNTLVTSPSMKSKMTVESGGSMYSEVNGRIVIPIDEKFNKGSLGIVHDASRSGKTVYIEPTEIIGPTNELRQAEAELRSEEARVWRSLTEQILSNRASLDASVSAAGQLDLIMAKVQLGIKLSGVIPEVASEGVISLKDAKHPVLLLREIDNVVGSDIDLGADGNQGLVLTGPNSGGKTIILKMLGLLALMVRNGIPIPASKGSSTHAPRVDFFDPVLADIGDIQSVGGDLSTFSGHMLVCREVLASSGENALVLMDELGSGTDPAQGVAIAQALLEALVETGARCAITTHYMELKQLAASDDRFSVGGMQFVNGRPTYKLLPGTVGESFALAVAERFNIPQKVIDRANELLDQETRQMGDLIREMEDQKAIIDQQVAELEQKKAEMENLELEMKKQQQVLEAKQLSARRDEAKKFAKTLEDKERILEDILEKLKNDPSRRLIARSWEDIKFTKRDVLNEAEKVPSVMQARAANLASREETYAELIPLAELRNKPAIAVGDKLQICQKGQMFGKEAIVLKINKNKLEVKIGAMAMQVKMTDVALPNSNVKPEASPVSGKGDRNAKAVERALAKETGGGEVTISAPHTPKSTVSIRTESNTVDVRGCNLEEAKSKILDRISMCLQANRMVMYVLHGYGEKGVLRSKVRDWLKSERTLVKRSSPADSSDGGDAFTKIELR
ncbi:DNA-binding domain of DNA mismatch repair MUTS family [Fragilaria crotonensis]|nr:DNA-binding domain of DNA mismatch repair MUTS family [Fragilaria crotonensis]